MLRSPLRSPLRPSLSAAVAFSPAQFGSQIAGWWDATDLNAVFSDTAMTTRASFGQGVAAIRDKGAGGNHLTQSTGTACPLLQSGGGVLFDGTDDFLENSDSAGLPNGTTPCEIFALVRQDALVADATARAIISYGGGSAATRRTLQRNVSSSNNRIQAIAGDNSGTGLAQYTAEAFSGVHVAHAVVGATATTIALNGGTPVSASVSVNTGSTRIRLGALTATTAANFWNGAMGEVIVTTALSTADRTSMVSYLLAKRSLL